MSPGEHHENVYMVTPLSVFRNDTFTRKNRWSSIHKPIYIYLESVLPGEHHKHIYMATLFFVFKEKTKMVLLPEKRNELQA